MLSDYELKTRQLLSEGLKPEDGFTVRALATVFRAMWASSLPFDRIVEIANALHNSKFDENQVTQSLKTLVRRGVLRSRKHGGIRFWEVNY
jgi:hypothetical protein